MPKFVEAKRSIETHTESMIFAYLQDAYGAPIQGVKFKIWAGPPPVGEPPYFVDDDPNNPNRRTDANGRFQFVVGPVSNRTDFFVQPLDASGNPQSDPIQYTFQPGQTVWITVILTPQGSTGGGGTIPPIPELQIDPRLTNILHVSVQFAQISAGQTYWKLISAQYQDEFESGGNINIVCTVQNEFGQPAVGQTVVQAWPDGSASQRTSGFGVVEFPMSGDSSFAPDRGEHGPYSAYVADLPSDRVVGMGLPLKRHVQYLLTWRKVIAGAAPANSSIIGKISNAPAGTQVALTSASLSRTSGLDATGNYSFGNLPAGTYSISVTGAGVIASNLALDGKNSVRADYTFAVAPKRDSRVSGNIQNAPANAQLTLASGAQTFMATVDAAGYYAFANLPAGTYSLALANIGVINASIVLDGTNAVTFNYEIPVKPPGKVLVHYLLFGSPAQSVTRTNLVLALDYIARFAPTVGFSVNEAKGAQNVTIVGTGAVSAADEQSLRDAGCTVRHIAGADSYAVEQQFAQLVATGNPYPNS